MVRMPQMPGLYPTFLSLSGTAVSNLMTISDSVVQLSNRFSFLHRKSSLVCAHPFLNLPLMTFGVMGHNSF